MSRISRSFQQLLCLGALAATPSALATTFPSAEMNADCDGYSITFHATGFVAVGESINVSWQVALQDQSTGERIVVLGQATATETEPLDGVVDLTVHETWPAQLCGSHLILLPFEDDGQGSFYQYGDSNLGGREVITVLAPPDRVLDCSCDSVLEVCRTPGFWGTHAGTEKSGSSNITLAVLNAVNGVEVCGKLVDSTAVASGSSALEAMCVSPRGDKRLQLVRQLTATALNCVMSGGGPFCEGVSIGETFNRCNALCESAANNDEVVACIDALDCFNNGGNMLSNGMCQKGTCANETADPCSRSADCGCDPAGASIACNPLPESCHTRPLINTDLGLSFPNPGPAGSSSACHAANRNGCTLLACDGGAPSSGGSCGGWHRRWRRPR